MDINDSYYLDTNDFPLVTSHKWMNGWNKTLKPENLKLKPQILLRRFHPVFILVLLLNNVVLASVSNYFLNPLITITGLEHFTLLSHYVTECKADIIVTLFKSHRY